VIDVHVCTSITRIALLFFFLNLNLDILVLLEVVFVGVEVVDTIVKSMLINISLLILTFND
jgi:hypothetical protein